MDNIKNKIFFSIKLLVSVLILAYLFTSLDLDDLIKQLVSLNLNYFMAAVLTLAFPIALTSLRWQILLRAQKIYIPVNQVVIIDLIGCFFNSFLPGSTGGDAYRVLYVIRQYATKKTKVILSILLDRGLGLIALLILVLMLPIFYSDLIPAIKPIVDYFPYLIIALAICGILLLTLIVSPRHLLPNIGKRLIDKADEISFFNKILIFLRDQRNQPLALLLAIIITAISYGFNFLSGYLAATSLGLELSYLQVVTILSILYIIISIPISLGGHGVRELTLIALLAYSLNADQNTKEIAVAYSLILFSIQLIWSIIGGVVFLLHRQKSAPNL